MLSDNKILTSASSVIFIKDRLVYEKSDAVIEIAKLLKGWPSLFKRSIIIPRFLRNTIYKLIAANRYAIFGKQSKCMVPKEEDKKRFV